MKKRRVKLLLIAIFWLLLWQLLYVIVASRLLLPSPLDTVRAVFSLLGDNKFYLDATATIARCVVAIFFSLIFGAFLSVVSYRRKIIRDILALPVALFKTIPIMAVAIYMILLMTSGSVPVLVCFVMCFPIVYTNLLTGLDSMDKNLLEMAKVYDIIGMRRLRFVYLPSLYPYFKSAMSLIAGMSWKAIVTAEVLSIPRFSLGYELMNSKYYLNTDLLFAYVTVIIGISIVFEKVIKRAVSLLEPHAYASSKIHKIKSTQNQASNIATRLSNKQNTRGFDKSIKSRNIQNADNANTTNISSLLNDNSKKIDFESASEINNLDIAVELKSISKKFGNRQVLNDFSLKLPTGSVMACMGASGSGKTTLLRIIAGLEKADTGEVVINTKKASVLFQEDRLLPWLNVYDNLAIVCSDSNRIKQLLESVGLESDSAKLPAELSGGMKYRLAMARAFAYDGDLLLVDEPFQGLDEATKASVIEQLWKPGIIGKTVFFATHSQDDKFLASFTLNL